MTYSCYSSTYKTFSRIDYFLLSTDLTSKVRNCWYDSILISDHAAVSFTLNFPNFLCRPPRWRLHITWLRDPEFLEFIDKQIDYYFEINTNQTSASVRWEAFKAFIRGRMISYTNYKYKRCQAEMVNLENKIKKIESKIYQKTFGIAQIENEI